MVTNSANVLSDLLFGKTRQAILALLFMRPDETFHLRHIVRLAGVGLGAAQRELTALAAGGLLLRTPRGRQIFYGVNPQSPIYPEMRSLVAKTVGLIDHLRSALSGYSDRIRLAVVFGSVAAGQQRAISDLDLLVVADGLELSDLVRVLKPLESVIHREINPILYNNGDFSEKVRGGHHFLKRVLEGPKLFVIGDEHELKRMAQKRLAVETSAARSFGAERTSRRRGSRPA